MTRLSNSTLIGALRFVRKLNSAKTLTELRAIIPAGLSALISSDRVSLNEIDFCSEGRAVVPSPFPAWWPRLGELYREHAHEHPIWSSHHRIRCNQVITLADYGSDPAWKSSALYNDYYVPLDMRCQLGVLVHRAGSSRVAVALNRSHRDFAAADRALLELISPHTSNAFRNALALVAARRQLDEPFQATLLGSQILETKLDCRTIRHHSPAAVVILRAFFRRDTGTDAYLPEAVGRWLRVQKECLLRGELSIKPMVPLVVERGDRKLTIRLACLRPEGATLLLDCDALRGRGPIPVPLTLRESEILHWVGEGKRDGEIGMILGVSSRTVGKHLEHIFAKLGVETRTAAARAAYEMEWHRDA